MKEYLGPHLHEAHDLGELGQLVVSTGRILLAEFPDKMIDYLGGPITADGPDHILRNLGILRSHAENIRKAEQIFVYTNPDVGDLRRFPGMGEPDFMKYSAGLLRSGIFGRLTLLEGWKKSTGSRDEYRVALELGIPIREIPILSQVLF